MGQLLEQALRYCLLALELGRRVGCEARAVSDVYYLALLEHVGCTATAAVPVSRHFLYQSLAVGREGMAAVEQDVTASALWPV